MIDPDTITDLQALDIVINAAIDRLIPKRDQAIDDKGTYRYIVRRLESCLGLVHRALDRVDQNNLEKV